MGRSSAYAGFAVVIAVCVLTGCSGAAGTGVAREVRPGVPEGLIIDALSQAPAAAWLDRGETFAIVTYGSGSCPPIATAIDADGPDRVVVTFRSSPNDPCSADIAPATHEFELPDEVTGRPVFVEIVHEAVPGADTLMLE